MQVTELPQKACCFVQERHVIIKSQNKLGREFFLGSTDVIWS